MSVARAWRSSTLLSSWDPAFVQALARETWTCWLIKETRSLAVLLRNTWRSCLHVFSLLLMDLGLERSIASHHKRKIEFSKSSTVSCGSSTHRPRKCAGPFHFDVVYLVTPRAQATKHGSIRSRASCVACRDFMAGRLARPWVVSIVFICWVVCVAFHLSSTGLIAPSPGSQKEWSKGEIVEDQRSVSCPSHSCVGDVHLNHQVVKSHSLRNALQNDVFHV